ncbi:hypothetical protein [Actinokineospora enzanensis]|uniref:hypothetical protein n=1 Tax=Actinokineospora enzanensis TaxID=155975 RepID=UPI000366D649|nr:hypothetical protein [Actinokineospora enzanensis]
MSGPVINARFGSVGARSEAPLGGNLARSVAFSAAVRLAEEELVAAVWDALCNGWTVADFTGPAVTRELVTDRVINEGLIEVNSCALKMAWVRESSAEFVWVREARRLVLEAFGPALPPARRVALSRQLATTTGVAR